MAYPSPIKDYASKERQEECKNFARKLFIKRVAKNSFYPAEEYEEDLYQPASDSKFLIAIIIGIVLIMSLYLVNTQAKAEDCVKPISPMSLVDYWGNE